MIPSAEAASFGVSVWKNDATMSLWEWFFVFLCYMSFQSFRNVLRAFGLWGLWVCLPGLQRIAINLWWPVPWSFCLCWIAQLQQLRQDLRETLWFGEGKQLEMPRVWQVTVTTSAYWYSELVSTSGRRPKKPICNCNFCNLLVPCHTFKVEVSERYVRYASVKLPKCG